MSQKPKSSTKTIVQQLKRPLPAAALDFQTDALALESRALPFPARIVLYAIIAFLLLSVTWAGLSHIDRIVVASGRLVAVAQPVVLQPLETAVIRSIDVQVGDVVSAGTVVATLDATFAKADLAELAGRIAIAEAQVARLSAELDERSYIPPASLIGRLQKELYQRRQSEFRSRRDAFLERAGKIQASLETNRAAEGGLQKRLEVMIEIEGMREELVRRNAGSRLMALEATRDRLSVKDDLDRLINQDRELQHELKGVEADQLAFIAEWRSKIAEELAEQSKQLDSLLEQKRKAERRTTLVTLVTPVDAVVLDIAKRSIGSVIKEAEPLITLIAADVPMEAEVEIPADEVGPVRVGDHVRVKLEAFPFQRYGTLDGEVKTISADAFQKEQMTMQKAVFRSRIALLTTTLKAVPKGTRLSPGLDCLAEIKIGTRSVLAYFLYPIIRALDESIREP